MSISVGENLNHNESQTIFDFQRLLNLTKDKLKSQDGVSQRGDFWKSFEVDVSRAACSSAEDLGLPWDIELVSGHKFPDIVARINMKQSLGIEVKTLSTKSSSWKVMGGSIMESTRIPDVSRIQVLCAKQNPFEIKIRPFEDCVSNVAVTHSPRYMLDMDLNKGDSLFEKINQSYEDVRQMSNPFDAFKSHLIESKKSSRNSEDDEESLWWYSPEAREVSTQDYEEQKFAEDLINSKIKFWNELSAQEKNRYKVEMLVKSPSIIVGDYNNACKWLLKTKGIINPSFRDTFSAGGQEVLNGIKVPKIIANVYKWKDDLVCVFKSCELPKDSFFHWKSLIEKMTKFSNAEKKVLLDIVSEIGRCL